MTITVFHEEAACKMLIPHKDGEDSLGTMFEKAVRNLKESSEMVSQVATDCSND